MEPKTKKIVKIAVAVLAVGFVGLAAYVGIPHLTGGNHNLPRDSANSPVALIEWMIRASRNDEPQKIWNAMNDEFRAQFVEAFDKVAKREVPVEAWEKAAKAADLAGDIAAFAQLDPMKKFQVWWNLEDRSIVGFRVPAFIAVPTGSSPAVVVLRSFFDDKSPEKAGEGYLLYQINGKSDILHCTRVDGVWRLAAPKDIPEGM